jgi:hypothetical protein
MENIYCGDCKYCIPKEKDQTNKKEDHICKLYKIRLLHFNNHPNIVKCKKCLERKIEK